MPKVEFNHDLITSLRKQKGWSYYQFGKHINADKLSVESWEQARTTPSAKHLTNMCNKFGVIPAAFWRQVATA